MDIWAVSVLETQVAMFVFLINSGVEFLATISIILILIPVEAVDGVVNWLLYDGPDVVCASEPYKLLSYLMQLFVHV